LQAVSQEGEEQHPDTRPSRQRLALVVTPIVGLIVCGYIGDALTTTWAKDHPLWLIMLNARSRILVLTTNQLDAVTFYAVASLRLLASDPLFYLLGRWYGDAMIQWVENRSKTFGEQIRLYERAFAKAAYPLVFLMPNPYICLFAGASGMRVGAFFTLNIAGTVARLYLIRRVGEAFDEPIQGVLRFFGEYRLPLFILSVALVLGILWSDRRSGKNEIGSMLDLAEHGPDEPPEPSKPGEPTGDDSAAQ
jgi:membrane protein DedA with SNARE-associated domain